MMERDIFVQSNGNVLVFPLNKTKKRKIVNFGSNNEEGHMNR